MSLAAVAGRTVGATPAPHPGSRADTFDMRWVDKVQGKFRAVFDSPEIADGAALFRAILWCDEYKEVYGTPRTDMSPVIVFRHQAIVLTMNDAYWKQYKVGKQHKMKGPDGKWGEVNPIRVTPTDTPPAFANYNLEEFIKDGGIVLGCNLAFGEIVGRVQHDEKLAPEAARTRALSLMIPGITLQPSGVFAALRAQEAGCKYIGAA